MIRPGRWILAAVMIAVVATAAVTGCKKHKNIDAFPASGAVSGWQKSSETRVFDAKNLWQYIDGEAEVYIAAGVVSASTSDYKYQGKLEAVVDVYTMSDAVGARKILETGQTNEAKTLQLGDAGLVYAQSVIFRKGPYLVRIVAYDATPETSQDLLALAYGVEAKM